jgi:hypothetical protein
MEELIMIIELNSFLNVYFLIVPLHEAITELAQPHKRKAQRIRTVVYGR